MPTSAYIKWSKNALTAAINELLILWLLLNAQLNVLSHNIFEAEGVQMIVTAGRLHALFPPCAPPPAHQRVMIDF